MKPKNFDNFHTEINRKSPKIGFWADYLNNICLSTIFCHLDLSFIKYWSVETNNKRFSIIYCHKIENPLIEQSSFRYGIS